MNKEEILNRVENVIGIPEFEPIVKMCEKWLSQRDETKFEKTNKQLLESHMNTTWLPMGGHEKFTCRFVNIIDFIENTEKDKCCVDCARNYLKNKQ